MAAETAAVPRTGFGWAGWSGVVATLALGGVLAGWAATTQISGAVVATGTVIVAGKPKAVQHLDGGIVETIAVRDGDRVAEGDLLVRLDSTLLAANLQIYRNRLAEGQARRARLEAERSGAGAIAFGPPDPLLAGRDITRFEAAEAAIFAARSEIQAGQLAQIDERVAQFRNQIDGIEALVEAKREQVGFIEQELDRLRTLLEKQLVREGQILTLQGTRSDVLGQIAEHLSEIARIGNSIRDAELEKLQSVRRFREEAVKELRDVSQQVEEVTQQILATEKQLGRVEIRAPVAGYVHELQIVTVGGVVPPGATMGQIIAADDELGFELQVAPQEIDQVYPGQALRVRFSTFNQRTTPELSGTVAAVSPATVQDPVTGMSYYRVLARIPQEELARLGALALVPGMPLEGYVGTGERSVASYLLRPLTEQFQRAFREE
ncbi:MAG TPA: HlyD family type I secretion periplasmic adaptor subunit [Paracoccaceae bacterium]|nr:HlyD family type I secretion periplasmic adaptor subunit [Paracoccaceae bacterium]